VEADPPVTFAPMRFGTSWPGGGRVEELGERAERLVGVVSVSPVMRAATNPSTTASGTVSAPT
jgi:hypothetical protein